MDIENFTLLGVDTDQLFVRSNSHLWGYSSEDFKLPCKFDITSLQVVGI